VTVETVVEYGTSARVLDYKDEWTCLMRSAIDGDNVAYHRLLRGVVPVLRAAARRGLERAPQLVVQSEDIVQDILLAIHLKRHIWGHGCGCCAVAFAIARNNVHLDGLPERQRDVLRSIAIENASIKATAIKRFMNEGGVRVALPGFARSLTAN
jgi:RNA polymerase sigma-70 factor (ECF subfamily)